MDIAIAFVSFFALVAAWLVLPNSRIAATADAPRDVVPATAQAA